MPQYLIVSYLPDDYDPSKESAETIEKIFALNREMIAAGIRRFACGLSPQAVTLQRQEDGEVLLTDGPFLEAKEVLGGLAVIETATKEEALEWARRGAALSRAPVEVREVFFRPAPEQS